MILTQLNLGSVKDGEFDNRMDMFLIAAFNKIPIDITAENIIQRKYRAWLLQITEEFNQKAVTNFDILDVVVRCQQLRKAGRLRNRGEASQKVIGDSIEEAPVIGE